MNEPDSLSNLAEGKPASSADFILARRARVVRKALAEQRGTLLDFGCGNGAQTTILADDYDLAVGVDVNFGFLREFDRGLNLDHPDRATLAVCYDGDRLPVGDGVIDTVVSFEVLEHVNNDRRALEEIVRVLKPGGRIAISVPNRWWIFETHGANLPLLPWNRVPLFSWLPKTVHDKWARARIYRRREIVTMVREAGLTIEQNTYVTAPMDVIPWRWLKNVLRATVFRSDTTRVPFLSTAVFVSARKS